MARKPHPTDFQVPIEGIGTFTFARRAMREEIDIQREFARILNGVEPTAWLATVGGWLSTLRVLTVAAPDGWDIEAMDPTDNETYEKLGRVHDALLAQERSFRRGPGVASQASGA